MMSRDALDTWKREHDALTDALILIRNLMTSIVISESMDEARNWLEVNEGFPARWIKSHREAADALRKVQS